jgi:hypothetical protein
MIWIAPPEKDAANETLEVRFAARRAVLGKQAAGSGRGSVLDSPAAYPADGMET